MNKPLTSDDDRWLDVLAGRASADDAATRQAAKARDYLVRQAEADQASPVDEQRLKRLLNGLDAQAEQLARAARPMPATAASSPSTNPLARLLGWMFPSGAGGLRHAGMAAAVLGLAVAVLVLLKPGGDDDSGTMKGLPPGASQPVPALGDGTLQIAAADPVARAGTVQSLLRERGVQAQVVALGDRVQLDAAVPADRMADVQAALATQGITWPGGGQLSLEFVAGGK